MKNLSLLLLLLLSVSFIACEKEVEVTKTDLLTKSNWFEVAPVETCNEDDFYKFDTNKTMKFIVGDPCDLGFGDATGLWSFENNETQLVTNTFGADTSTINTLTETTLKLTDSYGDSYEFRH